MGVYFYGVLIFRWVPVVGEKMCNRIMRRWLVVWELLLL